MLNKQIITHLNQQIENQKNNIDLYMVDVDKRRLIEQNENLNEKLLSQKRNYLQQISDLRLKNPLQITSTSILSKSASINSKSKSNKSNNSDWNDA